MTLLARSASEIPLLSVGGVQAILLEPYYDHGVIGSAGSYKILQADFSMTYMLKGFPTGGKGVGISTNPILS